MNSTSPSRDVGRFRKLRIAFSAACGFVCLLLIVLWVRSYKLRDYYSIGQLANRGWAVESAVGQLAFRIYSINHNAIALAWSQTAVPDDPSWPANNRFGFDVYFGRDYAGIVVPHWLLVLLAAFVAASAAIGRPIRFRFGSLKRFGHYLRIGFSVGSGVACMLLIVLWVRSYVYCDSLAGPISETKRLHVGSLAGAVQLRLDDETWSDPNSFRWKITIDSVADLNKSLDAFRELQVKLGSRQANTCINMTKRIGWELDTLFLPYWLLVLLTGALAAAVGMHRPYRFSFSLRTLLISMTLVAAEFGLIVAFSR